MVLCFLMLPLAQSRPSPDWLPVLQGPAKLTHVLTIPPPKHAGPRLVLEGRALYGDGKPAAGVVLYIHHTDARGIYPRPPEARPADWSHWHGVLRGWLRTDAKGRYRIETTKPAPYPGGREPAHLHVYGLLPGSRTGFYLADFVFRGEPFVNADYWSRVRSAGLQAYGGVALKRQGAGWHGKRDLLIPR